MERFFASRFILVFFLTSSVVASDLRDSGAWSAIRVKRKCDYGTWLQEVSHRWDEDAKHLTYQFIELGFQIPLTENWSFTPWYRHGIQENLRSHRTYWKSDRVAMLDLTYSGQLGKVQWSDRNRLQYGSLQNNWWYRNRIRFSFPAFLYSRLKPDLYNETFFEKAHFLIQNRMSPGIKLRVNSRAELRLGYLLRHRKRGNKWKREDIALIEINLAYVE